ncbi:MAG: ATP-binding protein [Victivallaceae bacterium]|nr:ATP-binding protein [Victivallaceae bacterium]
MSETAPNDSGAFFSELIYRAVESDTLDYKGPMNFLSIGHAGRAKLARHMAALANTRGGAIVVGVGEDLSGHPSVYTGLTPGEAHSFDPSNVGSFVNKAFEPAIDFTVERPLVDGKRYAVIQVRPFADLPHVCSCACENELQQGVFYIRTPEAASRAACRAAELHDLVRRALRRQRSMLAELIRGVLAEDRALAPPAPTGHDEAYFAEDCEYLRSYFLRRKAASLPQDGSWFELTAHPPVYSAMRGTLEQLRSILESSGPERGLVGDREVRTSYVTSSSIRALVENAPKFWQLGRNGLFELCFAPGGQLRKDFGFFCEEMERTCVRLGRIYEKLLGPDEPVSLSLNRYRIDSASPTGCTLLKMTLPAKSLAAGVVKVDEESCKTLASDWL